MANLKYFSQLENFKVDSTKVFLQEENNTLATDKDMTWMSAYATQRMELHTMNRAHDKYPQIFSHAVYKVRPASPTEDYFFEKRFENAALIFTSEWTKKMQQSIYCNSRGEKISATPNTQPFAYRSGAGTWTASNPACFFRKDIERKDNNPDVPFTTWTPDGECILDSQANFSFFTVTDVRSDKNYTMRLNTISTGADAYLKKNRGFWSFSAEQNEFYCNEFFKKFDKEGKYCYDPWWKKVLSYTLFGTQLVLMIQAACDKNTNKKTYSEDLGLFPELDGIPREIFDVEFWENNINTNNRIPAPDILLSDLGFTNEMRTLAKRGQFIWISTENGLVEEFLLFKQPFNQWVKTSDQLSDLAYMTEKYYQDNATFYSKKNTLKMSQEEVLEWINEHFKEFGSNIMHVLTMLIDPDFLLELGVSIGASVIESAILDKIKQFIRKKLPILLNKGINKVFAKASARMFQQVMKKTMARIVTAAMVKLAGKLALALVMCSSGILTVVGIIELISLCLDLLTLFGWDPLGFNNEFSSALYDELFQAEISRRVSGDGDKINPSIFASFILNINDENDEKGEENGTQQQFQSTRIFTREPTKNWFSIDATSINFNSAVPLRPTVYPDIESFCLFLYGQYLTFRTGNSYGQRFDWDEDTINFNNTITEKILSTVDIFDVILRKADEPKYVAPLQDRMSLTVLTLLITTILTLMLMFVNYTFATSIAVIGSLLSAFVKFSGFNVFKLLTETQPFL